MAPFSVTGLTSNPELPMKNWSSIAKADSSWGKTTKWGLIATGKPPILYDARIFSPENRQSRSAGFPECGIPHRQHIVAQTDCVFDDSLVRLIEQVRFPTLSVDVCVRTEEWREDSDLVPTSEHFRVRVAKESSNISCSYSCEHTQIRLHEGELTYIRRTRTLRGC